MVNQNILILRPKFNIFWAIFIRLFLTFNTSAIELNPEYKNNAKTDPDFEKIGEDDRFKKLIED
jgi:hypothetical protein